MEIDRSKIVIFGAGKIGRSFIGQLFGTAGHQLVFAEADPVLAGRLNSRGAYDVVFKGENDQWIHVGHVTAIHSSQVEEIAREVASAALTSVNVGKDAIDKVIPVIALGLIRRYAGKPDEPLDILIAENMMDGAIYFRDRLKRLLPEDFPIDSYIGLVETSIGKMVPIMPEAVLKGDPLLLYAEPYNELILDGKGFLGSIPRVPGLAPKNNIRAWVDRKAFIHNLGHATAAYHGFRLRPDIKWLHEALDDPEILEFTRAVMIQSAEILMRLHPAEFSWKDLEDHISDLLVRFRNKALNDTIFRVGKELTRKLASGDRFVVPVRTALSMGLPCDLIIMAMAEGFLFGATDENGAENRADHLFLGMLEHNFEGALFNQLGLDPQQDGYLVRKLKEFRDDMSHSL